MPNVAIATLSLFSFVCTLAIAIAVSYTLKTPMIWKFVFISIAGSVGILCGVLALVYKGDK